MQRVDRHQQKVEKIIDALFEQLNNHIVEKSIAMEIVTQLVKKGLVETDVNN